MEQSPISTSWKRCPLDFATQQAFGRSQGPPEVLIALLISYKRFSKIND